MTVVREIRRQCELETRRFHFSRITKSLWKTLAIRACTCGEQWRIGFFTSWHATCSTSSSHLGSGESKSTCEARHPRCGRRPQGDGLVFQRRFSNDTDQRCDETAPAVRSGGSRKPRVRRRGVGKSGEGLRAAQQAAAVPVCQPAKPVGAATGSKASPFAARLAPAKPVPPVCEPARAIARHGILHDHLVNSVWRLRWALGHGVHSVVSHAEPQPVAAPAGPKPVAAPAPPAPVPTPPPPATK